MPPHTLSHSFRTDGRLPPEVLDTVEIRGPYPRSINRVCRGSWVVDYEYTSHGSTKVEAPVSRWQPRASGSVHLYPPKVTFFEDTCSERGSRHSAWIHFTGGDEVGLRRLVNASFGFARFLDVGGRVGELFHECAQAAHRFGDAAQWRARGTLCYIIDLLLSSKPTGHESYLVELEPASTEVEGSLRRRVIPFFKDHISEKITLSRLARHLHVSVSTVAHRYRDETGESPMVTLARLRVEHAKTLLAKGLPLKAIAAQLAFCDAFHFSRVFKRVEGTSPSVFARRLRDRVELG